MSNMLSNENKMTQEQSEFAAEHYEEVVGGFLRVMNVMKLPEDFRSIVALKYLCAVRCYLSRTDLQERYTFKAIAYKKMKSAVYDHWAKENRRRSVTVSLDDVCDTGLKARESALGVSSRVYERAEAQDTWAKIKPLLTPKELDALYMKAQGFSCREIADKAGIKPSGIYSRFFRMRRKIKMSGVTE